MQIALIVIAAIVRVQNQKETFAHFALTVIWSLRCPLFISLYHMTEFGKSRCVNGGIQQYFPCLFPSKADSNSRRCHREPPTVLWHHPRPVSQSQFSHPDVWRASQENQTIDITKKSSAAIHQRRLRELSRQFYQQTANEYAVKQTAVQTGPPCLTSLCLCPRLVDGKKAPASSQEPLWGFNHTTILIWLGRRPRKQQS